MNNLRKSIFAQRGFSLIETMIVVGIVGVIGMAVATSLTTMSRHTRALNEKLAQMEALRLVTSAIGQAAICKSMLTVPWQFGFNSMALPATGGLPSGSVPMGVGSSALTVGQPASPTSNTLIVSSLDMVNIVNAGSPDLWTGDLRVGFDNSKLVMPLKALMAKIMFETDPASPPTNKRVISCSSGMSVTGSLNQNGYTRLPNGLLLQWGVATAQANNRTTIYFTKPFPSKVFSIVVGGSADTGSNSKDNWPALFRHPAMTTLSTFQVTSANGTADPISWFAVGM